MLQIVSRVLRGIGTAVLFAVVALCVAIVAVPPFLDRIYYEGPQSAHYDGERFFNPDGEDTFRVPGGTSRGGFIVRYLTGGDDRPPWPDRVNITPAYPPAAVTPCPVLKSAVVENWKRCIDRVDPNIMYATWIGHATVLVQTQGLNILTDPIWSSHAGPFDRFGPKRVASPGMRFEDLPKIDLVVVSHNHYDHMDVATLKRLWDRDKPLIVTSLGNETLLRKAGVKAVGADWGRRLAVRPGVDVIVNRNHHWSSRWFTDRNRALWSSFVVTLPGGNLFFAGDTGFGDGQWPVEARRYGPVRLALIPIGAFRFEPGQMNVGSHIGPIQAAEVHARLGAPPAIGIHWGTFRLSYEAWDTPPKLLRAVMKCRAASGFGTVAIGLPMSIPAVTARVAAKPMRRSDVDRCLDTPDVRALR